VLLSHPLQCPQTLHEIPAFRVLEISAFKNQASAVHKSDVLEAAQIDREMEIHSNSAFLDHCPNLLRDVQIGAPLCQTGPSRCNQDKIQEAMINQLLSYNGTMRMKKTTSP
jgi:hypothetical protein